MRIKNEVEYKIETSFLSMIETLPFKKIKMTSIIKEANVSHQTFYRYYEDKYDLALKITDEKLSAFSDIYGDNPSWKEIAMSILYTIKNNAVLFKRLIKDEDGSEIIKRSLLNISELLTGKSMSIHVAAVWLSVLNEWLESNLKVSVEETYVKLLHNLPVCEVLPKEETEKQTANYENHTLSFFIQNNGAADSSFLNTRGGKERKYKTL